VFRTAAVDENVPKVFNTFMVDVVKEFYRSMPRYRSFWDMITVKNITLISSAEAESSEVSVDMAAKFLLEEEVVVEVEVVAKAGDEEDDMFAEMQ
jgi:Ku C terminal domain like